MIEVIKKGQGTVNIFIIIIIIDCAPPPALQEGDLARCSGSSCSWPLLPCCTSRGWGKLSPLTLQQLLPSHGHFLQMLDSANQFRGRVPFYSSGVTYKNQLRNVQVLAPTFLVTCYVMNARDKKVHKKPTTLKTYLIRTLKMPVLIT